MYRREANDGHIVEWEPENKPAAKKAVVNTDGTGVNDVSELEHEKPLVDEKVVEEIRREYKSILSDEATN